MNRYKVTVEIGGGSKPINPSDYKPERVFSMQVAGSEEEAKRQSEMSVGGAVVYCDLVEKDVEQ